MHYGLQEPTAMANVLPALQTLERSYLLRVNGVVVERPQHMLMRVSVGIHKEVRGAAWAANKPRLVRKAGAACKTELRHPPNRK